MILHTKNGLGADVSYTDELAQDLKAVHNIDVVRLFQGMKGTSFSVKKFYKGVSFNHHLLHFVLETNDPRDPVLAWDVIE